MWIKVWNTDGKFAGTLFVENEEELESASRIYPKWIYVR